MNGDQFETQTLPIDACAEDYINRPLSEGIEKLKLSIARGKQKPSFEDALAICDAARSVFAAYLVEFALNGAVRYQRDVLNYFPAAQTILERTLEAARNNGGLHLAYLEEYVDHNRNRIKVVDVLHDEGREAAEELLLCGQQK